MIRALLRQKSSGKKYLLMSKGIPKAKLNRRAAIGAAMTWVVATFIILFVVILFIYSSNLMAKEKDLKSVDVSVLNGKKVAGISSEQILLGILKTKIGIRSVSNYISQGDYEEIRSSVESILDTLPELNGKAVVYVGNKNVELNENILEIKNA